MLMQNIPNLAVELDLGQAFQHIPRIAQDH